MKKTASSPKEYKVKSLVVNWGFSWAGLKTNRNGEWWLVSQLIIISAHFLPPTSLNINISLPVMISIKSIAILIFLLGSYVCLISLLTLGRNLSPLPEPMKEAHLVTSRIYKYCRHPLYLSLIIISISINLFLISGLHIFLLLSLIMILIGKAKSEEKRLLGAYSDYKDYMQITPAIIKGLFLFDWRS